MTTRRLIGLLVLLTEVACSGTASSPGQGHPGGQTNVGAARGGSTSAASSALGGSGQVGSTTLGGATANSASANGGSGGGGASSNSAKVGGTASSEPTVSRGGGAFGGNASTSQSAERGGQSGASTSTDSSRGGVASTRGGQSATGASANATAGKSGGGTSAIGSGSGGASGSSAAKGGTTFGGAGSGATSTSAGQAATLPKFIIGADISSVDEALDSGSRFADTDGTVKPIFEILKNHGFNFIRLRAFVDPGAEYGYAYGTGGSCIKTEPYCDTAHTLAFAKQVKAAGMGLLLDLHYSDTWTDPGNQIIPKAWRGAANIGALADFVRNYTKDIVTQLANGGARPDIVQIGNETTPGMLMHVPNADTDCWGNNVSAAPIGGSTANWTNLGTLLKAGIDGVKSVDTSIKTMVHIENTKSSSGVVSWVSNAKKQGVAMDIVGLSCYAAFQGEPSVWAAAFSALASNFSELSFVIAEYNPQRTAASQVMRDLPNGRGLGTFFWEPTQSGEWGTSLFTWSGNTARANAADFAEFDTIAKSVGLK